MEEVQAWGHPALGSTLDAAEPRQAPACGWNLAMSPKVLGGRQAYAQSPTSEEAPSQSQQHPEFWFPDLLPGSLAQGTCFLIVG